MNVEKLMRWASPQWILVATNLEDESVLTCEATAQARASGAKILLVHVLQSPSLRAGFGAELESAAPESRRGAAWNALLHMAKMIEWEGAVCEPVLLEGEPVEQIPALAGRRAVDRVIVATRSTRGLDRLLTGSVAESLMTALDVPVCVIGPRAVHNPFRSMRGGHILLTLSLHHDRLDCVQLASLLAVRRRSILTFLHVLDVAGMGTASRKDARGAAHASIVALASAVPGPLPEFLIAIREGSPPHKILDEDSCPGWDFIVMGSSSPGVVSQLMGSSVVHRVVAEARCPVITLQPSRERQLEKMLETTGLRVGEEQESALQSAHE